MNRQDYQLIADWVQANTHMLELRDELTGERLPNQLAFKRATDAIANLADRLEQGNPNFNRDKFLETCGVQA